MDPFDHAMHQAALVEAWCRSGVLIYATCDMPNHFHYLVRSVRWHDVSDLMEWQQTPFVQRLNHRHKLKGHVWQGRFKAIPVEDGKHALTAMRYIERNPVAAGLVDRAEDYPWCSAAARAGRVDMPFLSEMPGMPNNWLELVNTPLTEKELNKMRRSIDQEQPFGDEEWCEEARALFGFRSPRKSRRERSKG